MLDLPILNIRLNACSKDWQQMTPVEQGRHCAHCNRTVLDFTASTQADLEAAFQTAPDGRVCGRFRQSQLAPKPQLRPKLRRFLVALVLVCGLGLTSEDAWAQVRKVHTTVAKKSKVPVRKIPKLDETPEMPFETTGGLMIAQNEVVSTPGAQQVYWYAEQMPVYRNGGVEGLNKFIQKNLRWPTGSRMLDAEGKVFIGFIIDKTGKVRDAKVLKGIHPTLDAEALRVVQLLDGLFEPGRQNNLPVDVRYTLPVNFERK